MSCILCQLEPRGIRGLFFPHVSLNGNRLDITLKNSTDSNQFKRVYLKNIRPEKNHTCEILDKYGLKLLSCLRVDFSDLRSHRFDHNFNCADPTCKCELDEESTDHYLLRCPRFSFPRAALLRSVSDAVNPELLNLPHDHLSKILLFGSTVYNEISNKLIVEATIRFVKKSKRFKTLEAFSEINNP